MRFILAAIAALGCGATLPAVASDRPNVVFIFVDDK